MTDQLTVYVNGVPTRVPPGSTVVEAVAMYEARLADLLRNRAAKLTDGVGRSIEPTDPIVAGTIIRVIETTRDRP